ncbi:MAG: isocitrate/isopropylmalate family dehydrogenase [Pseudomonadota bacterium]
MPGPVSFPDHLAPVRDGLEGTSLKHRVVVLGGTGIGPELTAAARRVIDAIFPSIQWIEVEPQTDGRNGALDDDIRELIADAGVALTGPAITGSKPGVNPLDDAFDLCVDVRPIRELPSVPSRFSGSGIDFSIVRDRTTDRHAPVEYQQTPDLTRTLEASSRTDCERVTQFAFDLARATGRERIVCATRTGTGRMVDRQFKRAFEKAAEAVPDIVAHHLAADRCIHKLASTPADIDLMVASPEVGSVLIELACALIGGSRFVPAALYGPDVVVFQTGRDRMPELAGRDVANPIAAILAGAMLVRHLGGLTAADKIERALMVTLSEARSLTPDIAHSGTGGSSTDFVDEIIDNLGAVSDSVSVRPGCGRAVPAGRPARPTRTPRGFAGIDVFVEWSGTGDALAGRLSRAIRKLPFDLEGVGGDVGTDHWQCRFRQDGSIGRRGEQRAICALLEAVSGICPWMHVERLHLFEGRPAFSRI